MRADNDVPDASSWTPAQLAFDFQQDVVSRRPRGWERAPRAPHLARHKGRKVWKRPDVLAKASTGNEDKGDVSRIDSETRAPLAEVSNNTPRAVKKLRLKDDLLSTVNGRNRGKIKYLTTLHEACSATPRRKRVAPIVSNDIEAQKLNGKDTSILSGVSKGIFQSSDLDEDVLLHVEEPAQINKTPRLAQSPQAFADVPADQEVEELELQTQAMGSPVQTPKRLALPSLHDASNAKHGTRATSPRKRVTRSVRRLSSPVKPKRKFRETEAHSTPNLVLLGSGVDGSTFKVPLLPPAEHQLQEKAPLAGPVTEEPLEQVLSCILPDTFAASDIVRSETAPLSLPATPKAAGHPVRIATPLDFNVRASEVETPQIGTTLLRRESTRRTSPRKQGSPTKRATSPLKPAPLKKRDTLQEREILHQFNYTETEASGGTQDTALASVVRTDEPIALDAVKVTCKQSPSGSSAPEKTPEAQLPLAGEPIRSEPIENIEIPTLEAATIANVLDEGEFEVVDPSQTEYAGEPEIQQVPVVEPTNREASSEHENVQEHAAIEAALGSQEVNCGDDSVHEGQELDEVPMQATRSTSSRYSDDTSMLKEFVSRAQAKKAAVKDISQAAPSLFATMDSSSDLLVSPRRSPRKVSDTSIASTEAQSTRRRKGDEPTPSSHPKSTLQHEAPTNGTEETTALAPDANCEMVEVAPTQQRRSTRSRLPAIAKPPAAPSYIPLRRGVGEAVDATTVVLPKTAAQDLVTLTRNNTRRNKGQAKPPVLVLAQQEVTFTLISPEKGQVAGSPEKASTAKSKAKSKRTKQAKGIAKAVNWAEKLTEYHGEDAGADEGKMMDVANGGDESTVTKSSDSEDRHQQKPRVRRMRGLGSVNGTPAKSRGGVFGSVDIAAAAEATTSEQALEPKRRGGRSRV